MVGFTEWIGGSWCPVNALGVGDEAWNRELCTTPWRTEQTPILLLLVTVTDELQPFSLGSSSGSAFHRCLSEGSALCFRLEFVSPTK